MFGKWLEAIYCNSMSKINVDYEPYTVTLQRKWHLQPILTSR